MGKFSAKRKKKRNQHLRQLAEQDPKRFSREWSRYLSSQTIEAARRAVQLGSPEGKILMAFDVVTEVGQRLQEIGEHAIAIEAAATARDLTGIAAKMIARAGDHRLHRLVQVMRPIRLPKTPTN